MNVEQTFLTIQEELKQRIGEASFESWLDGLSFDEFDPSGQLTLSLPNRFSADFVRRNYMTVLTETFSGHFDDIKSIAINVKTNVRKTEKTISTATPVNDQAITPISIPMDQTNNTEASWFVESLVNDTFTFNHFCTGPSNQLAYAVAHKVATTSEKLYNPLFLYAPVGLGKTHLLHAIAHHIRETTPKRRVLYTSIQKFSEMFVRSIKAKEAYRFKEQFNGVQVLLIDDFQFIDGKKSFQQEFLHILNDFISSGRQVVVSSNRPLNVLGLLPALKSRLVSGMISDIGKPEKELRHAIIQEKSEKLGATLHPTIKDFLSETLTRNVRELEGGLRRIFAHTQLTNKILSLKEVRHILSDMIETPGTQTNLETILQKTSAYFGVTISEIMGKARTQRIVYARRMVMFLSSKHTDLSYADIGRKMGGKDHSTILYAVRAVTEMQKSTPQLFDDIESLETILETS
ncbi:MAG: chromosomal replication initiator protein DnaA [Alphaproteobacteria bacterium]|nr:chromosomal replication initiator protein DnaA [Alphaproteobacteria bacterium]MBN2780067.1 chromosomal replication initiator protein DnaA [Alphaproteobacteria bacterium]